MPAAASAIARAQAALQAGQRARIVRRARLAPARAEDAAQLRFAVEDALNTAEFNDCGRLIVVRHLRLQGLAPRAGAAFVARAIEEAWRAAARQAVPSMHPAAAQAAAVYFGSRFEARAAWLERVVTGRDVAAWFWRAAMPELSPVMAAGGAAASSVQMVLEAMLHESAPAAVEALAGWTDEALVALAGVVGEAMNQRLLAVMVVPRDGLLVSATGSQPAVPATRRIAPDVVRGLSQRVARASQVGSVPPWIAALWLAQALGSPVSHETVQWLISSPPDEPIARSTERNAAPNAVIPAKAGIHSPQASTLSGQRRDARELPAQRSDPRHGPPVRPASPPASVPTPGTASVLRMETPTHAARPRSPSTLRLPRAYPWLADAMPTDHGGLLILLNVLTALRFDQWLEANPQGPGFVDALFRHVLALARCPSHDPQWSWFLPPLPLGEGWGEGRGDEASTSDARSTPALTPALSQREREQNGGAARRAQSQPDSALAPGPRLWTARLRRALRRHVRLDLPALIARRAWVSTTATHIDLVYPLDDVELRLRRHNLDADPGWVPWFGRIVAFHFVARDLLPEEPLDG